MAQLHTIDYAILILFFLSTLAIGWRTMRQLNKSAESKGDDQTGGGITARAPWWLLGFSLVATTFSADTPNLVTDIVRQNGVSGNWVWWAFLPTGMTTVFIYAKLWRKLNVLTDIEFYETRYSGGSGAFVRGFRTLYLGLIVNTLIMASVTLAIVKIFGVMLGMSELTTILIAGTITVVFTAAGGFSAVLWADFVLFIIAMAGSVAAAIIAVRLPQVGGLSGLFSHPEVASKLSFLPDFSDTKALLTLLIVPLVVQWWSAWYPGAEPGGGSYTAQRMLAAKTPGHAVGATLFFNICHYAVRPWPWIIVALASIIVFPDLESLRQSFPNLAESKVGHDMAYPAMMTLLPPGVFGIVVASLFAAYMSTIATHLNLGASYMVNDFHNRFVETTKEKKARKSTNGRRKGRRWNKPGKESVASKRSQSSGTFVKVMAWLREAVDYVYYAFFNRNDQDLETWNKKKQIFIVRFWTVFFMIIAAAMALQLKDALGAFEIMLQIGAGTGLLFLLRWFWWRINAYSEIAAMCFAFPIACYFQLWHKDFCLGFMTEQAFNASWLSSPSVQLVASVALTTIGWLTVTFLTPPDDKETLRAFVRKTRAGGPGWKKVYEDAAKEGVKLEGADDKWSAPLGVLCSVVGCVVIYAALFAVGALLYGQIARGCVLIAVAAVGSFALFACWKKMENVDAKNAEVAA